MSENTSRWTSDHLLKPGGTALYAAQQRERLRQMADEVQALLREYRADLEAIRIEGDKPLEPKVRAFLASRPLAKLESSLRDAVNAAGKLDTEYQRRYVELPVKREQRAADKALEKARRAEMANARAITTAGHIHRISQGMEDTHSERKEIAKTDSGDGQEPTFLDFLKRA